MDKYVVEPRHEDGTLDTKDPNGCFMTFSADGVFGKELFDYYFKYHEGQSSASWADLTTFFKSKGWYIRKKTG
jgi:hypothetical protein